MKEARPSQAIVAVELPEFHGPLDLLLHLIKKGELDIQEVALAQVAEQFTRQVQLLTEADLENVGEYLVVAATLLEIKSRRLLPESPSPTAPEGPAGELVKQLLEYQRFRAAAVQFEGLVQAQSRRHARPLVASEARGEKPHGWNLGSIQLWDLIREFDRLQRSTLPAPPQALVVDETPLEQHMESLLQRLVAEQRLAFHQLFASTLPRAQQIGRFLALLELVRQQRLRLDRGAAGELLLHLVGSAPPAPE